jgi:hypothetical protein
VAASDNGIVVLMKAPNRLQLSSITNADDKNVGQQ